MRLGGRDKEGKIHQEKHSRENKHTKPFKTSEFIKEKKWNRKDLNTAQTSSLLSVYNYWTNFHSKLLVKSKT